MTVEVIRILVVWVVKMIKRLVKILVGVPDMIKMYGYINDENTGMGI